MRLYTRICTSKWEMAIWTITFITGSWVASISIPMNCQLCSFDWHHIPSMYHHTIMYHHHLITNLHTNVSPYYVLLIALYTASYLIQMSILNNEFTSILFLWGGWVRSRLCASPEECCFRPPTTRRCRAGDRLASYCKPSLTLELWDCPTR